MRRIVIFAFILLAMRCTRAHAQSCPAGYTRVADTLAGPVAPSTGLPTLFFGSVTIAATSEGTGANGVAFGRLPMKLTGIANGAVSVCLIPNTTALPRGTTYLVTYNYVGPRGAAPAWTETWVVTASTGALKLGDVRRPSLFACPGLLSLSRLTDDQLLHLTNADLAVLTN